MKQINKKEKGFSILAIILVIVAVIVAIGVWALSGQTNTSSSGNSTSDIQASSLINDSGAIKLAFDTLVINGSNASSIVFVPNTASTPSAPNMLDPVNGVQVPKPNANAIKVNPTTTEGFWIYNQVDLIVVNGVKDIVCQRINNNLHGSIAIPKFDSTPYFDDATIQNPMTSSPIHLPIESKDWIAGCLSVDSADENIFFRVLKKLK